MTNPGFAIQVTVDCLEPHPLADWWAETLAWEVEPQDEAFIRSMIDQGHATLDDTTSHRGALVWRQGAAIRPRDPAVPDRPRILFAQVPEAKTTKNRMHIDLRTGIDDGEALEALRRSLVERGATIIGEGRQGPLAWKVMTDPEGNEFCV